MPIPTPFPSPLAYSCWLPTLAFNSPYCLRLYGHGPLFYYPYSIEGVTGKVQSSRAPVLWSINGWTPPAKARLSLLSRQAGVSRHPAGSLRCLVQEAGGEQVIPTAFSGISSLTLASTLCLSSYGVQPELCTGNSIPLLGCDSRQMDNPEDAEWQ